MGCEYGWNDDLDLGGIVSGVDERVERRDEEGCVVWSDGVSEDARERPRRIRTGPEPLYEEDEIVDDARVLSSVAKYRTAVKGNAKSRRSR